MGRRREARSLIDQLIELKELDKLKDILIDTKKEEKKEIKKEWHKRIELYILLMLFWPFVSTVTLSLWKISTTLNAMLLR